MRDIILFVSLVAVSLAYRQCGRIGIVRRPRSSDQVGKRQTIYGPYGKTAGQVEFPWQVLIHTSEMGMRKELVCGGTLIEKDWVLTAAHCFKQLQAILDSGLDLRVSVAVWRQYTSDGTEQEIRIKKIIRHELFNEKTMENDIALIQLAKNAGIGWEYAGTACLPEPGDNYEDSGPNCWGSGWGDWLKPAPAPEQPDELQKVIGEILDESFVKQIWPNANEIFPGMIGFEAPYSQEGYRSGFCDGDSGGPVVCPSKSKRRRYDVVGIISWGTKSCKDNISILTSVTYFLEWIKDNMK